MPQPEQSVSIWIKYLSSDKADVKVEPEEVTIYYNSKGFPGDSSLARKVRWEVQDIREGDHVVVRAKKSLSEWAKTIFAPPAGKKHFEATSKERSIVCGPPVFDVNPASFPIRWEYEVVACRAGREIGIQDPAVVIDEDP